MRLETILTLDQVDDHAFLGRSRAGTETRIFGGEVAGQAVMAAGRTVTPDRAIHSAQCTYLRPGDPSLPVLYRVDPLRDGRSFSTRQVDAVQHGAVIFHMIASYHVPETGPVHQEARLTAPRAQDLPPPDDQLRDDEDALRWVHHLRDRMPADFRLPQPEVTAPGGRPRPPRQQAWIRAAHPLPADPLVHAGALTYLSDMFLLSTSLKPHGINFTTQPIQFATLTHAVYFHAPATADDWLFYDQDAPWAGAARTLCRGSLLAPDGTLVASTVQEGLLRL